jgi:hypothetical protein
MQMDIAEMARQCDIHRIVPLNPAVIAALERFACLVGGKETCLAILERRAKETNSPPMKSALLSAAEEIRNEQ